MAHIRNRCAPSRQRLVDGLGMFEVADVRHWKRLHLALIEVPGADPDGIELAEHIELGQSDRTNAVQRHAVAGDDGIEPADAPGPSGRGAVFDAALPDLLP